MQWENAVARYPFPRPAIALATVKTPRRNKYDIFPICLPISRQKIRRLLEKNKNEKCIITPVSNYHILCATQQKLSNDSFTKTPVFKLIAPHSPFPHQTWHMRCKNQK